MKRTFELTHEQIDLIVNCLFIASDQYYKQFEIVKSTFKHEDKETKLFWYDKANKIAELAGDIKNGEFDV